MATPKSKSSMDPNYEKQLRRRKTEAAADHAARTQGNQARWGRPEGWNGDPFDFAGMHRAFNRDEANRQLVDAIKDDKNPGTTGDVVLCSTEINRLSVMERAFKVRHTLRRCRATAQALARKRGHGDDKGPYVQLGIEYLRALLRQAKKPPQ